METLIDEKENLIDKLEENNIAVEVIIRKIRFLRYKYSKWNFFVSNKIRKLVHERDILFLESLIILDNLESLDFMISLDKIV